MTRACQLTVVGTTSQKLWPLILAALGYTYPPPGNQFPFPSLVSTLQLLLPINQATNSGVQMSVQDINGNEISSLITGIPFIITDSVNSIDLQGFKVQGAATGMVLDVTVNSK
jgi:hypothetical protein